MFRSQNHFKHFYIMEHQVNANTKFCSEKIVIKPINIEDLYNFENQNFCDIVSCIKKGIEVLGIYDKMKNPIGFGSLQSKGETGDYVYIKDCDYYISNLFIFPEYRGKSYMKEFLKCMLCHEGTYRLCVRTNNDSAISCYKKIGFEVVFSRYILRIIKEIVFPRFRI